MTVEAGKMIIFIYFYCEMSDSVKSFNILLKHFFMQTIQTLQTETMDTRAPCVRLINEINKHNMKASESLKLTLKHDRVQQFLSQCLL